MATAIQWQRLEEMWSATEAEHAYAGDYELIAFDIPPTPGDQRRIVAWELFADRGKGDLVETGNAESFEAAKAAAEAAYRVREN